MSILDNYVYHNAVIVRAKVGVMSCHVLYFSLGKGLQVVDCRWGWEGEEAEGCRERKGLDGERRQEKGTERGTEVLRG